MCFGFLYIFPLSCAGLLMSCVSRRLLAWGVSYHYKLFIILLKILIRLNTLNYNIKYQLSFINCVTVIYREIYLISLNKLFSIRNTYIDKTIISYSHTCCLKRWPVKCTYVWLKNTIVSSGYKPWFSSRNGHLWQLWFVVLT